MLFWRPLPNGKQLYGMKISNSNSTSEIRETLIFGIFFETKIHLKSHTHVLSCIIKSSDETFLEPENSVFWVWVGQVKIRKKGL